MFTNPLNGQNAPAKLYPLLALYHLLPLHFPITTWGFDVPWGRFSTPSKLNLNGNIAWFVMEIVSPATFLWTLRNPSLPSMGAPAKIMAGCFLIHYTHRAIISPLILSPRKSPMHISAPVSAIAYNTLNGYCMAVFLSIWGPRDFTSTFWLGIAGWALGFIGNVYHDEILNDLRRPSNRRLITTAGPEEEKDKKTGNGRYAIPRGGLFSLVSFPNYLCEWFEWALFAVAGGTCLISTPALSSLAGSMPASVYNLIPSGVWPSYLLSPPWMFLLFEISCMLPRAINAHHWYYKTFGDRYPPSRKIVVPYLL